jgi:hypothetical protein
VDYKFDVGKHFLKRNGLSRLVLCVTGLVSGAFVSLNLFAALSMSYSIPLGTFLLTTSVLSVLFMALFILLKMAAGSIAARILHAAPTIEIYEKYDSLTFLSFLLTGFGSFGFSGIALLIGSTVVFLLSQFFLISLARHEAKRISGQIFKGWLFIFYMLSGFAAIIYQIVWYRALFSIYGTDIQSITVIVSVFIFGLGVGTLIGGLLSMRYRANLLHVFLACEVGTGLFGLSSLFVLNLISKLLLYDSIIANTLAVYTVLCFPTLLMGATFPVLIEYLNITNQHAGRSVGLLYGANACGASIACFFTVDILFIFTGLKGSIISAALMNFAVGFFILSHILLKDSKTYPITAPAENDPLKSREALL